MRLYSELFNSLSSGLVVISLSSGLVVVSLLFQCAIKQTMVFHDDPDLMEKEILKYIPVNTPISTAKDVMAENRFKCKYVSNGRFVRLRYNPDNPSRYKEKLYTNRDYLSCDISKIVGVLVERRWQVSLLHTNSRVTEVAVSTELTGL